jgi:hypothetical protein
MTAWCCLEQLGAVPGTDLLDNLHVAELVVELSGDLLSVDHQALDT